MMNYNIIDIHNDIASNALDATGKDIGRRYELYEGTPRIPGVVAHNNVDIPRLKEGGVKLVFATIFALDEVSLNQLKAQEQTEYDFNKLSNLTFGIESVREQMDYYNQVFERYSNLITKVTTLEGYTAVIDSDKVGFLIHLEGVDYVDPQLELLDQLYDFGVRSLALTWRNRNVFGAGNNSTGGLTDAGRLLIAYTKERGVVFDLAHTNEQTFWDCMDVIDFPVIVSHTLCRSINENSRNLNDRQIKAVAERGGVIGLAAIPEFIGGGSIVDYVKHFQYIVNLVGDDYVCFGTDFDGLVGSDDTFVSGFDGSDKFSNVIDEFRRVGFNEVTIEKICYRNVEKVLKEVLKR